LNLDVKKIRAGIRESVPSIDRAGLEVGQNEAYTYVPPSHAKALDPDSSLIEGIRGAGKSFWWSALASETHKGFISAAFPDAHLSDSVTIAHGFGDALSASIPSKDVIASLVKKRLPPRALWRAVLAEMAGFSGDYKALVAGAKSNWEGKLRWVIDNPEAFDEQLREIDSALEKKGRHLVILFDALDRLADTWDEIRPLARSLLQVGLDVRATRRIRFKMFVRPDMLEDREIIGFPDASKLLARRTVLNWRRVDLYALLFQCVGNSPNGGANFRSFVKDRFDTPYQKVGRLWAISPELRADESLQEKLFIALAGKAMSASPTGQKRGKPYSWLVNHLQDGRDQVSPRSFSEALRQAADGTKNEFPAHRLPLHFTAIQVGVQAASQVRVDELVKEDYPWVDTLMRPLKGVLTVPCTARDINAIWKKSKVLSELQNSAEDPSALVKLPPQRLDEGYEGVLADLEGLGVVQRLTDGRIQMPDVYRIAFGLGRRGGVKPLK
jgi:hypothetical protein